jgi:hypothetical protein
MIINTCKMYKIAILTQIIQLKILKKKINTIIQISLTRIIILKN